jgi:fluoride exporter
MINRGRGESRQALRHPRFLKKVKQRIKLPAVRRRVNNQVMIAYLWVALGGALGSVGRYWLNGLVSDKFGATFPFGTLAINITGSFLIGIFAGLALPEGRLDPPARSFVTQFLMIGVCGGYTTFSSFSLQTLNLLREREYLYAGGNVLLSVLLCLIAVGLGFILGSVFNSTK